MRRREALESTYRDGTTHVVMSPLEFMQRLAALVPRPRLHLIRFHRVLAPNAKLRAAIVPTPAQIATGHATEHAQHLPARMTWARLLKGVFDIDIEHCPNCGGAVKIIAAIEAPPVIVRILAHLGLPTRARTAAFGNAQTTGAFESHTARFFRSALQRKLDRLCSTTFDLDRFAQPKYGIGKRDCAISTVLSFS